MELMLLCSTDACKQTLGSGSKPDTDGLKNRNLLGWKSPERAKRDVLLVMNLTGRPCRTPIRIAGKLHNAGPIASSNILSWQRGYFPDDESSHKYCVQNSGLRAPSEARIKGLQDRLVLWVHFRYET